MCIITEGQTTSEKKIDRTAKTNRLIHYRSWRFRFQHLTLKWADAVGVSKDTIEVNIPINHLFAIVIYKLVCPTTAEQTFIKTYQNLCSLEGIPTCSPHSGGEELHPTSHKAGGLHSVFDVLKRRELSFLHHF